MVTKGELAEVLQTVPIAAVFGWPGRGDQAIRCWGNDRDFEFEPLDEA